MRSFATGIIPWFARAGAAFIGLLYGLKLSSVGDAAAQFFRTLSLNQTFQQGFFLSLLFLGAVLLNISKERFWCRYLCPAGALLGLFSRWNVTKVRVDMDKCIKCNLCTLHSQTQANPYPNEEWRSSECVYCYTCASICPTNALRKAPVIDLDLCIGCGICENKCPVMDDPAIYCTSVGEDRNKKNLLLETLQPTAITEEPKDTYR